MIARGFVERDSLWSKSYSGSSQREHIVYPSSIPAQDLEVELGQGV